LTARALSEADQRVLEISGPGFETVRLFLGAQHQIVKQQVSAAVPGGRRARQEESFGDYRLVGGLRVPYQATVSQDGRPIARRTVTRIAFNEPVDPSLFTYPEAAAQTPGASKPSSNRE
jgi:hypothetical protein